MYVCKYVHIFEHIHKRKSNDEGPCIELTRLKSYTYRVLWGVLTLSPKPQTPKPVALNPKTLMNPYSTLDPRNLVYLFGAPSSISVLYVSP